MMTVHKLRKAGFKVQVRHFRCYDDDINTPLSKGGSTEVLITYPPQEGIGTCSVVGIAECSPKDNFDRKRGVRIALGRALKNMGYPTK